MTGLTPYDNYEIHPCKRHEEPDKPGFFYFEQCEPEEADVWTLYGHCPEGGLEAIGDFGSRETAEATFHRIVGVRFGSHEERAARVRMMQAAPILLEALRRYLAARPAFRLKPVGAPGSQAREEQEEAVSAEDFAKSVIKEVA